jgi:TRAP transporter TAXI family solute receptor
MVAGKLTGALLAAALCVHSGAAPAASAAYKIVTASERGTYFAIGTDLAKFVAPAADIDLEVLPTAGSAANIRLLRYEPGVKFAIVQADVFQAFVDRASAGKPEAGAIIRPLRVILPLYNTEIHYIVRADSELNYLHDIRNAKINGGLLGSGAALITATLYRMMFGGPIPEANASYLAMEEALVKLIGDKSVDVVVVAAGQPAPLIANMRPEAQKLIKFLKFDPDHPCQASYDLHVLHRPHQQLSAPVDRRLHHDRGGRVPGHLRLQYAGHGQRACAVRSIAVPEFLQAAG